MRDEVLQRIREAKLRRLEILEEQIASVGEAYAEPQQRIERDDLKKFLGLSAAVVDGGLSEEDRRLFRRYDQADLNIAVLSNVVQRVTSLEEWIAVDRALRPARQRVLNAWLLLISIALLLLLGARFL